MKDTGVTRKASHSALVVRPYLAASGGSLEDNLARLQETIGLAEAIGLEVEDAQAIKQRAPRPATYLGKGYIEELSGLVRHKKIGLVIIDTAISPIQQRNLEKAWQTKVIDRTGLILEIFGERARTAEGRLQVELAALTYQRSRLVRSWTHLERQRGGFGFLGGPGESQLEVDRRLIEERILRIKKQLSGVKRTRALQRKARKRSAYPIVALVGYTNAGKSTLFNRLTRANVLAKYMLFATLDPTMRQIQLPSKKYVILADTVGFISELPTQLVAAFHATLEEVIEADLILHIRDISHPQTAGQLQDVMTVLKQLGLGEEYKTDIIEVLNKSDLLPGLEKSAMAQKALRAHDPQQILISAITGEGCNELLKAIEDHLFREYQEVRLKVQLSDGAYLAWLYSHGQVIARRDDENYAHLKVRLSPEDAAKIRT